MIYLASPYSHSDKEVMERRFSEACEIAGKLMAAGLVIFCPTAHTHPIAVRCELPRGWYYWHKFDYEFIAASSKVVVAMMDGWIDSKGVTAEISIALQLGKVVEYLDVATLTAQKEEK